MSNGFMRTMQKQKYATLSETPQKNEMHACKRDRKRPAKKSKESSALERVRNEIRTRYQIAYFEAMKEQGRVAFQHALGFPYWSARCPETPQKRDTRLKNEIGMNFSNQFPPTFTCHMWISLGKYLWRGCFRTPQLLRSCSRSPPCGD